MNPVADAIMKDFQDKLDKTLEKVKEHLASIRAGRANIGMLDIVMVDYYGTPTPLKQAANLSTLDAQTICIEPWDKSIIKNIEKGITNSNLGLNPSNDGVKLLIKIPALTAERRKEYVKMAKSQSEDGKVAIRNLRKDVNNKLRKSQKDGDVTEDELKSYEDTVQKHTDSYIKKIDEILVIKEKDINTL